MSSGPGIRALASAVAAAGATLAFAAQAHGAPRIVTWDDPGVSESPFVDPAKAPGSWNEPPGVPDRPNALRVNVYLPDGYRRRGRRRYPVLYLLGGSGDAYDSWAHERQGRLLETLPDFPGFIVMPEAGDSSYANWWNNGWLGDPAWERYHLDQLVAEVERRLPIRSGRRWRAVAGLSAGGRGAVFYASQRPGYFGSAAAFSAPLSHQRLEHTALSLGPAWGDPVLQEFYWRGHNPTRLVENLRHTRVFAATGDGTTGDTGELAADAPGALLEMSIAQHNLEFRAAADRAGVPLTYRPRRGIHGWPPWRQDLRDAVQWGLFRPALRPAEAWTYLTVARTGRMWGLGFRFARQPQEVVRFERSGRLLRGRGSGRVEIRAGRRCTLTMELPSERRLPGGCP